MILRYSGKSKVSAALIQDELIELGMNVSFMREGKKGDINWGRERANTALNPDISKATNKRVMRELFQENKVPMPKLIDIDEREKTAGNFPIPMVGRPDKHMQGRGFWLINSWEDVLKARKGTKRKAAATHFMEYIEADKEMRVHIFNGKSIRMTEKKYEGETGSHRDYTTIKPTGNKQERRAIRRAAKKAVKALGLNFGAVDVLVKQGRPYVLEVNAAPGLGGTMPKLYAETFKKWYDKEKLNGEEDETK